MKRDISFPKVLINVPNTLNKLKIKHMAELVSQLAVRGIKPGGHLYPPGNFTANLYFYRYGLACIRNHFICLWCSVGV